MITSNTIDRTKDYVRQQFSGEGTGHDWFHIERVWKLAKQIAQTENADTNIVEMAALLHDISDHKLVKNPQEVILKLKNWLQDKKLTAEETEKIIYIVKNVSYKGVGTKDRMKFIEGKIVQDADRLDAMGAIGIARTFAYGGSKKRMIYDPSKKPVLHHSFEQYKTSKSPTINHFYEKLLHLKDRMHTQTGKKIAEGRHQTMIRFLESFFQEWDANE
jgi:uncharacterized protein